MFNPRREIIIKRHRRKADSKNSTMKSLLTAPKGNYLREFSSITSLHGIMYLGEPNRPIIEKVFWLAVMSLVMSLCGWKIYQLYNNWSSNHMIMTLDNNKYNIWDFPFPAITFCSDDQLQNIDHRPFKNKLFDKDMDEIIKLLHFHQEPQANENLTFIDPKHWQFIIENYKMECKNIVSKLYWLYDRVDQPCDYMQPILTLNGICYSLNMIPYHLLLNNDYYRTISILNHTRAEVLLKNETIWTPESSYSKNITPFDIPWRVTGDTVQNAVRLEFDLKNSVTEGESKSSTIRSSGLRLIVHNSADIPTGINPTAYIINKSMLTISLTVTIIRPSSKIKRWPPKIRNCYFQHEKVLKFFKVYTYLNCELECIANNTLRTCGCNAFYQPRDSGVAVCGPGSLKCIIKSSTIGYSIFDKQMNRFDHLNDINNNRCKCLPACTHILYNYETVELFKNWTSNSKILHRDVAVVIIYFKRKFILDVVKTPLITFNDLLGNIGGLFGLFLGCSIISFFEILYFFVIRLYFDGRNKRRTKSKITPNFIH